MLSNTKRQDLNKRGQTWMFALEPPERCVFVDSFTYCVNIENVVVDTFHGDFWK